MVCCVDVRTHHTEDLIFRPRLLIASPPPLRYIGLIGVQQISEGHFKLLVKLRFSLLDCSCFDAAVNEVPGAEWGGTHKLSGLVLGQFWLIGNIVHSLRGRIFKLSTVDNLLLIGPAAFWGFIQIDFFHLSCRLWHHCFDVDLLVDDLLDVIGSKFCLFGSFWAVFGATYGGQYLKW
jgi:hypothetical protein